jgi:eukaryotic-like serine/threonine-protein kinase
MLKIRNKIKPILSSPYLILLSIAYFLVFSILMLFSVTWSSFAVFAIPNSLSVTPGYQQYINDTYGVKIQYPSDWEKDSADDNPNDNVTYPIIRFSSPLENASDRFTENIVVATENPSPYKNLDQFLEGSIQWASGLKDFRVIKANTNSTLSGNPAFKLVHTYTWENEGSEIHGKNMWIGTIIDNKTYFILFLTESTNFDRYLPTIQKMIDSLQIL